MRLHHGRVTMLLSTSTGAEVIAVLRYSWVSQRENA